jgi:hypothetical protein
MPQQEDAPPVRPPPPDRATERAELQRILSSPVFGRSPTLSRLLAHVGERCLAGVQDELKESTIAVEVFRRPPDFDPRHDPIVRVTANRLRVALARFYRKHGHANGIEVQLPVGQYIPVFRRHAVPAAATAAEAGIGSSGPVADSDTGAAAHLGSRQASTDAASPYRAARTALGRHVVPLALAALAGLVAGFLLFGRRDQPQPEPQQAVTRLAPTGLADSAVRLLAGAATDALDPFGRLWSRDQFFEGGTAAALPVLESTGDHPAYRAQRKGSFTYQVPLPAGVYELHLHLIETQFGDTKVGAETSRMFDVEVNGRTLIHDLDVSADAGGSHTPDVKVLTDVSPAADGRLHLRFSHRSYEAILSGIEILPGLPGRMRPVRITALPTPYVTADGVLFLPDLFVRGGRHVPRERIVTGTSEPGLFRAERFGHFRYTIPAAAGRYRLSLTFAETFFGEANGVPVGRGARVFDVFCNGEALLRHLDVLDQAGGENRALVKTFEHLEPNAQGKLILDFVPERNLATVTAIELQAE